MLYAVLCTSLITYNFLLLYSLIAVSSSKRFSGTLILEILTQWNIVFQGPIGLDGPKGDPVRQSFNIAIFQLSITSK